jgi:hypothetical protein
MNSIRKFVYVSALTLSAFTFAPNLASAQNAAGKFTLIHSVRWQNATIPAGDYKFKIESRGTSEMLTLSKVSGPAGGYMLLVNDVTSAKELSDSRLTVVARGGKHYVKEMELPELGIRLNFAVPAVDEITKMEVASSSTGPR